MKQGDLLGPDLFTFYICGIMISWRAISDYPLPLFRSREDFVLTGRSHTAGNNADEFTVGDSEYADDTALLFCGRCCVEEQTPRLMEHFGRWGMEVHSGDGVKASKSEVLFCPAPLHTYSDPSTFDGADLSDVQLPGGRCMPVVTKFCYLGDMVSSDCGDACAVDARIEAAGKAFGALRSCIFTSTSLSHAAKARAYVRRHLEGIVLSILLYGCESWCLPEVLLQRLRVFHARCLRTMARVTRKHAWDHRSHLHRGADASARARRY